MKVDQPTVLAELEKEKLEPIALYEIVTVSGVSLFFAEYDANVTFNSKTYIAIPIGREVVRSSTEAGIDNLRLSLGNADQNLSLILQQNDGFRGTSVRVLLVFADLLSDPDNKIITFEGIVSATKITPNMIMFDVTSKLDVQHLSLPRRIYRADRCQWVYKDVLTCQYTGDLPTCDKVIDGTNGCRAHDNVIHYGGYPGIPEKRTTIF